MRLLIDTSNIESYRQFLAIKRLPSYRIRGCIAEFPDEYADRVGVAKRRKCTAMFYEPSAWCFDYQAEITRMALERRKFAIFADCGLGKTIMYFEWLRALRSIKGGALIVTPLMVVRQTIEEAAKFYGDELPIEQVAASDLQSWLKSCKGKVGITNYEAFRVDELDKGQLAALVVDESSILKSHYGKYGTAIVSLGKQLEWVLCGTGTPAPNDRIEYANHAVMLGQFPTVNSFLAKFFINRGQTQERWELKPHALEPFYRAISHWSIFLTNPATYGWKDNCESIPPIHVHIDDVPMTASQHDAVQKHTGGLFAANAGGITKRSMLSKIAKGLEGSETGKFVYIKSLLDSWPTESTIIWCWYNDEQDMLERCFPEAASIRGETKHEAREQLIAEFKSGQRKILISKPKVLGFGLNLQIATRQVFSSLFDSYEAYYQAVKRSNRYGSTKPLNVHIPVVDVERPMVDNVLRKVKMVQQDTETQERIFRNASL
jgi:hypothetical protein